MASLTTYTDEPLSAATYPASPRARFSMMEQLAEAVRIAHPSSGFAGVGLDEETARAVWAIWNSVSGKHVVPLEVPSTSLGSATVLDVGEPPKTISMPAEAADVLDWDTVIDEPPAERSGTLSVRLQYHGRDKPQPLHSPWSE
jgi:hypothetical protein